VGAPARSLGFCRAYPGPYALPDDAPFHLRKRREQVQEELGHRAVRAGIDGFRGAQETNPERNKFLDRTNAMSHAAAPTIQLPNQHSIEAVKPGVPQQAVELRSAGRGPAKARIYILLKDLKALPDLLAQFAELHLAALVCGAHGSVDGEMHGSLHERSVRVQSQARNEALGC
jgi:hypothetical protein